MQYIISFKNGHKMKINVDDGPTLIKALIKGPLEKPLSREQFYVQDNVMINVTDITACHPIDMEGD